MYAGLPGASPETMASSVATPLERQFGRIAGVTEMTSSSSLGSTSITLQFDLDRNIDAAARDVQAAINAARGQLPANLPNNPHVPEGEPGRRADPAALADVRRRRPRARMYDVGSSILQQKLAQVKGVGPGHRRRRRAAGRPRRREPDGAQRTRARARGRPHRPGRRQRQPPEGAARRRRHGLVARRRPTSSSRPPSTEPLIVAYRNGARRAPLRRRHASPTRSRTSGPAGLSNGKPAIIIIIFRQPGANIIETVDGIRALLPQLQASIPPTIKLDVVIDATQTIRASVRDVEIGRS